MTHDPLTRDPLLDAWLSTIDDDPNYSDYLTLIARVREDAAIEAVVRTPCTRCGDTGWTGRADDPQSCECGRRQ
jgi:hypothetical protein